MTRLIQALDAVIRNGSTREMDLSKPDRERKDEGHPNITNK
jgi:hypothetical protein